MMLTAVLNAAISLIARICGSGVAAYLAEPSGWGQTDYSYALAFGLATLLAWIGFDRRRTAIDKKFSSIKPSQSDVHRLLIGVILIGGSFALYSLGDSYPLAGLFVFVVAVVVGSWVLRRNAKVTQASR